MMRHPLVGRWRRRILAGALALAALGAMPVRAEAPPDPLEGLNRHVHAFNGLVRAHLLDPAAAFYVAHAPLPVRLGVSGVLANLGEPVTALSALAAGEFDLAAHAARRFGINTAFGWGGARDRAAEQGLPQRPFTPADAACRWGLPSGPFLVLPLVGPTSLRDAAAAAASGLALSQLLGAEAVTGWAGSQSFAAYAEAHRDLALAEAGALDPYAMLRAVHLQRRARHCPQDAPPG